MTVERELPWNPDGYRWVMWDAADCTCSASPTSTSRHRAVLAAAPAGRTWTTCGLTKAITRSAKPTTSPVRMYNALQITVTPPFRPTACMPACRLHAKQGHGQRLEPARHHPRHLLCAQPLGAGGVRYAPRVDRQLPVRTAVLQGPQPRRRQAAGRLADQRPHSVPVRHADQFGRGTDYAGVGLDGSMAGGIGNYWVYNNSGLDYQKTMAHNSGSTDANWWVYPFNEPNCHALGRRLHAEVERTRRRARSISSAGIRDMIYNPGFENWNLGLFKKFAIHEAHRLPVPRRGLRCLQPPQLERRRHRPDQPDHVHEGDQQERRRAQPATLATVLLLNGPVVGRGLPACPRFSSFTPTPPAVAAVSWYSTPHS